MEDHQKSLGVLKRVGKWLFNACGAFLLTDILFNRVFHWESLVHQALDSVSAFGVTSEQAVGFVYGALYAGLFFGATGWILFYVAERRLPHYFQILWGLPGWLPYIRTQVGNVTVLYDVVESDGIPRADFARDVALTQSRKLRKGKTEELVIRSPYTPDGKTSYCFLEVPDAYRVRFLTTGDLSWNEDFSRPHEGFRRYRTGPYRKRLHQDPVIFIQVMVVTRQHGTGGWGAVRNAFRTMYGPRWWLPRRRHQRNDNE